MQRLNPILFVDIETTGVLGRDADPKIIEAAFKLYYFDEHEGLKCFDSVHLMFPTEQADWDQANDYVNDMHTKNGLKEASLHCEEETDLCPVYDMLNRFSRDKCWAAFNEDGKRLKPYLGGNSVHFDRKHLEHHFPEFALQVHYRNFDVTSIATFMQMLGVPLYPKKKAHTAREDLLETLGELTHLARVASMGLVSLEGVAGTWEKLQEADVMEGDRE